MSEIKVKGDYWNDTIAIWCALCNDYHSIGYGSLLMEIGDDGIPHSFSVFKRLYDQNIKK